MKKKSVGMKARFDQLVKGYNANQKGAGYVWDIMTCLRSCDFTKYRNDDTLKRLTVQRLRYVVGLRYTIMDEGEKRCSVNDAPLTPTKMKIRAELIRQAPDHFRDHWEAAIMAVRALYHYDLNDEKDYSVQRKKKHG